LTFIYLEMPKFNKTVDELETRFEKWLYVIRNLNRLEKIPDKLRESVFEKLFKVAEIAQFTPDQVLSYEDSLKYYRDMKNSLDTAFEEGKEEGIEEGIEQGIEKGIEKGIERGRKEIVLLLDSRGKSVKEISELTGLTAEWINALLKNKR
ncbi:MAG: PD-(D/E)XK nuclease family transposase, partial [Saprospiraceae bacterium]